MGYTTDFDGAFSLSEPLTGPQREYLTAFNTTRRMKRNAELTAIRPDPVREAVGLPVGIEGEYFVGETGFAGQDHGDDVVNYNSPPSTQPGLWCQWTPGGDQGIEWDGGEKFYDYVEWLQYLRDNFLIPWGHVLNGQVEWVGEDPDDRGRIIVINNIVTTQHGRIVYEDD